MTGPLRLALVGFGKIARDQHVPAVAADDGFVLAATIGLKGRGVAGVPHFKSFDTMVRSGVAIDAVAVCTPPQARCAVAQRAVELGLHVFLEKPPGATLSEVAALRDAAADRGVTLFAGWHSRHADGVEPARAWLDGRRIRRVAITWREDVRRWHPGQDWIWGPGGFGVFDPGINALSIATRILPRAIFVERADFEVPANRATPIAARVDMRDADGVPIAMDLDFRQQGRQTWDIEVETDEGLLLLGEGGAALSIGGEAKPASGDLRTEYPGLYRRFAELVAAGGSDVDVAPLRLVADAFLRARTALVEPFEW